LIPDKPTHRLVESPKLSGRYLADYMAASERRRRTIIRDCKYRKIAQVINHQLAKAFIADFLKKGSQQPSELNDEADRLRNMMADTPFYRDVYDNNADFLQAYADTFDSSKLPTAEIVPFDEDFKIDLNGVNLNPDIKLALQRTTKTNRLRTGLFTIRYAKNKPLDEETGLWQSSILFGCRKMIDTEDETAAEQKLCVTLDACTGKMIEAPGDALSRFQNVEAACQSISERWDSVEPPPGAVLK